MGDRRVLNLIYFVLSLTRLLNRGERRGSSADGDCVVMEHTRDKYSTLFDEKVREWWDALYFHILDIREDGRTPIIVALSRKMPRFIDWFKNNYSQLEGVQILDEVEVTSELAIPFIFAYDNVSEKDFILVDDVMIHGDTMVQTALELKLLLSNASNSEKANTGLKISVVATHHDAGIIAHKDGTLRQEEIDVLVDDVSKAIGDDLPIDFEFPIFVSRQRINSEAFNRRLESVFKKECSSLDAECLNDSVRLCDLSKGLICFNKEAVADIADVDFLKCRFFDKKDTIAFEIFSPAVLSGYDLTERSELYSNQIYQRLWNSSTKKVTDTFRNAKSSEEMMAAIILRKSFERSLCVWANYLLAISVYNKILADGIDSEFPRDFALSKKELSWILGRKLTEIIWNDLESIIMHKEISAIAQTEIDGVPTVYCPDEFKSMIESTKGRLVVESSSAEEMLSGVFKIQHYTNPVFTKSVFRRYNIGETYMSLWDMMNRFVKDSDEKIHNWIDGMIDNGRIIPRYAVVQGANGMNYWRRFFHTGICSYNDL